MDNFRRFCEHKGKRGDVMETIEDIVRDIQDKWAVNYFCEGCRTMNGDYPKVVVIDTAELADRINVSHRLEIEKLRALVEGLLDAATIECASCTYDCGPNRENCIREQAIDWLGGEVK
ncbi:MAG: hypothetical protein MJZ81_11890 [Bacteroidales bacterium]|nr:hypothetical protein [Bacteroidales bacterium]